MTLTGLQAKLGVSFRDEGLLERALVHASYASEQVGDPLAHNERLEFLGDAVLELVTSEYLFRGFPAEQEGQLTNWRSILVNTRQLSNVARALGLNECVKLSRGEAKSEGGEKESILANTFESVVGALYLDQGYQAAQALIERALLNRMPEILAEASAYNPKGIFQEEAQRRLGITPTYTVLSESGPDHDKRFAVGAYLGEAMVARGEGSSKQDAQQDAAKKALAAKQWNTQ